MECILLESLRRTTLVETEIDEEVVECCDDVHIDIRIMKIELTKRGKTTRCMDN
jgi:hypothetical protein